MNVGNGEDATTANMDGPHTNTILYVAHLSVLYFTVGETGEKSVCGAGPALPGRHKLSCVPCSQLHSQSLQLPAFSIESEQQGPCHLGYHLLYVKRCSSHIGLDIIYGVNKPMIPYINNDTAFES